MPYTQRLGRTHPKTHALHAKAGPGTQKAKFQKVLLGCKIFKTCLSKEREARLLKRVVEASGSIVEVRQREVETRGYTDDAECPGFGSK